MASQQTFTNNPTEKEGHDVEQSVLPWSQSPAPTDPHMPSYQHNFIHNGVYPLYALPQQQQIQQRQAQSLLAFQQLSQPLCMPTWPSLQPSVPLHLPIEGRMPLELSAYQPFVPIPLPTHYTYSNMTLGQEFDDLQTIPPPDNFPPEAFDDDAELARATSVTSNAGSIAPHTDYSRSNGEPPRIDTRSASPNADEMAKWGVRDNDADGAWACAYPGCTSRSRFRRGCDLRKHYKRHSKNLFCRHAGCPQATERGFSSKKDRDRHEAKHDRMLTFFFFC